MLEFFLAIGFISVLMFLILLVFIYIGCKFIIFPFINFLFRNEKSKKF